MASITPIAYNIGTPILGTTQVGSLAVGTSSQDYSIEPGGVRYWATPDKELGYVIAEANVLGNQPNPLSISPANVGFYRSEALTEESFIDLAEYMSRFINDPQTFTGGTEAKDWLNTNGFWTSFVKYIVSDGKTTTGGFQVGDVISKDMVNSIFTYNASGMPNGTSPNLNTSVWTDWDGDIFDSWGYFYLYDPNINNYLGLQFNTINQPDGVIATESFSFNGRTFTIKHGYPVQGIYKFEIRVNDTLPFIFGEAGNMGSDGSTANNDLSHNYTIGGTNLTLWYNENYQTNNVIERFYSYYVPFLVDDNNSKTYVDTMISSDDLYFYSVPCTHGLTVYHSKRYDVKQWVVYDLTFGD